MLTTKITVVVRPNSKQQKVSFNMGVLKVHLKASPIDGLANKELIDLFSAALSIPKSMIKISSGASSKIKRLELAISKPLEEIVLMLQAERS